MGKADGVQICRNSWMKNLEYTKVFYYSCLTWYRHDNDVNEKVWSNKGLSFSFRAQQNQQSPVKGKGQGRDLKPPDLWIHDNMEMKNIDKGQRSESTLTMSTTRRSSNDYRSMDDLPPYHEDRSKNSSLVQGINKFEYMDYICVIFHVL